ncbi:brct domain containing protein [Diplocarpon rosae]|nr:brct domain containing protein [Diplocarpon rosae]
MPCRLPPTAKKHSNHGISSRAPAKKLPPKPIPFQNVKKERPQRQIFKGLIMSLAGSFVGIHGALSPQKIAKWITLHGARFEEEVSSHTTHLICSIEEYKKATKQVRDAWQLGTNRCVIVVFDWLEDCLQSNKKRCLSTKSYSVDRTIIRLKKQKALNMRESKRKFDDGIRVSKELSDNKPELYHIYYDSDAFEYKVILSRIRLDGTTMIEKYTLFLFESNNKFPPLYMFGAKLSRSHRPLSYYRQDCRPMDFPTAFTCFKKFFKEKSGVDWDMRLERLKPSPHASGHGEKVFFKYSPPIRGRPVGLLPLGYVRPEDRMPMLGTSGKGLGLCLNVSGGRAEDAQPREDVDYDTDSEVDEDELSHPVSGSSSSESTT